MVSSDKRNAENLLNRIRLCNGLEENKGLVFDFYHEKLASDATLGSMVNHLKILSRLVEFANKPFRELSKSLSQ